MNMLNQFRKTSSLRSVSGHRSVARPRNEARRPVIIVIAARVKPRVENESNVTRAGGGEQRVTHT